MPASANPEQQVVPHSVEAEPRLKAEPSVRMAGAA